MKPKNFKRSFNTSKSNFSLIKTVKQLLIFLYALSILYLYYTKKISILYTTILSIILGTIILIQNWPHKHDSLFKIMYNDDLNKFKEYLSKNNLTVKNIHTLKFVSNRTPILYSIEQRAFKIFKYLVENDYDLNYVGKNSQPAITFAVHSGTYEFVELLLKHKDKFDLYAKNKDFDANALEIAIWRTTKYDKKKEIEALLDSGMTFSISNYKKTKLELMDKFESIPFETKKLLAKRYVLDKLKNQLNLIEEIDNNKSLKSFDKVNIYWKEYLDFA